jgi:hypothetical protein
MEVPDPPPTELLLSEAEDLLPVSESEPYEPTTFTQLRYLLDAALDIDPNVRADVAYGYAGHV